MHLRVTLMLCLLSSPALAAGELPGLVVLSLQPGGGLEPAVATSFTEALTAEVTRTRLFKVTAQQELQTALGLERQRQLLGCAEEAQSCMAELADALGARFVMSGSLTKLGDTYQLNVQTVDSRKAQPIGRSTRLASSLEVLRAQLPFTVAEATATPAPVRPSRVPAFALVGAGAAAIVAGGVLFLQSLTREEAVLNELALAKEQRAFVLDPAESYRAEAKAVTELRIAGGIAAGVGAALVVAGVLVLPGENDVVRVAVVPTGNGVGLAGVFP